MLIALGLLGCESEHRAVPAPSPTVAVDWPMHPVRPPVSAALSPRFAEPSARRLRRPRHLSATGPNIEIVLFADLESPHLLRQLSILKQIDALPRERLTFRFFDRSSPYHLRGQKRAAALVRHAKPLEALLNWVSSPDAPLAAPAPARFATDETTARHLRLGNALALPTEVAWFLQGHLIDGSDPKAASIFAERLHAVVTNRKETSATLKNNLGLRWPDYRDGVQLGLDLGPPAPLRLLRHQIPKISGVLSHRPSNALVEPGRLLVFGLPDAPESRTAWERARVLANESGVTAEWLPIAPYTDAHSTALVASRWTPPAARDAAYRLAAALDIRSLPTTVLDGIALPGPRALSTLRDVWSRRSQAEPVADLPPFEDPHALVAPHTPTIGRGPLVVVFADPAHAPTRLVLGELLAGAQDGRFTLAVRHIPAPAQAHRERAARLLHLGTTDRDAYWKALVSTDAPNEPEPGPGRSALAMDVAAARRVFGTQHHIHSPMVIVEGTWMPTGMSDPVNIVQKALKTPGGR